MFLATSGHSGVDRVMGNLLPAIAERDVRVDLLHVKKHGPFIESRGNLRVIELGTSHAYSSLLPLVRYLRRERPDALLSDKDRVNRVALLARRFAGTGTRNIVRTGTTVSMDLDSRRPGDRFFTKMSMKYLYRWAYKVVLPSSAAVNDFLEVTGLSPEKVAAIPSPIATPDLYEKASMAAEHPWLIDKKMPVIMGIGELSGRKDFATLIRAFATVRSARPVKLIIFGEGRGRASLETMIREMNLSDDIQLPGFRANPYPDLARADLYVHSSTQEGAPVALMEAVALGVPCVSTDCPSGPAEILQGGRYGQLVQVGNAEMMAKAMIEYLDSPPEREFISQAARSFTMEVGTSAYMETMGIGQDR